MGSLSHILVSILVVVLGLALVAMLLNRIKECVKACIKSFFTSLLAKLGLESLFLVASYLFRRLRLGFLVVVVLRLVRSL